MGLRHHTTPARNYKAPPHRRLPADVPEDDDGEDDGHDEHAADDGHDDDDGYCNIKRETQ